MRFKKGSRVEVMNKKEVPISWRSAEILGCNRHTYSVQYDYNRGMDSGSLMERVSRKLVRPCPPWSPSFETREIGDIVELFDDMSWKIATILRIIPGDYCFVRLLGCSMELVAHKLNIRDKLLWLDDQWIRMGKTSGACRVKLLDDLSSPIFYPKVSIRVAKSDERTQNQSQKNCSEFHKKTVLLVSNKVSSRSLKRKSPWSSVIESSAGKSQKIRAVGNDGRRQKMTTPLVLEKVDVVADRREVLGESYMHSLFDNSMNGYNEQKRGTFKYTAGFASRGNLETNDSNGDSSSVGSCSAFSALQEGSSDDFAQCPFQVSNGILSDAESFFRSKDDEECCSFPLPEEEVARRIHDLELHAYRCTLEALHASGPSSWDQVSLLTNLRIMLHISNDEHLMEIRADCGAMHVLLLVVKA